MIEHVKIIIGAFGVLTFLLILIAGFAVVDVLMVGG